MLVIAVNTDHWSKSMHVLNEATKHIGMLLQSDKIKIPLVMFHSFQNEKKNIVIQK